MKAFDLVVLDLDGTLLDPDREAPIRPAVKAAIQKALGRGVGIAFASGRTWDYARHRMQELGVEIPMVSSHGATLVGCDGSILWEERLADELALRLAREAPHLSEVLSFYFRQRPSDRLVIRQTRAEQPMSFYHHLLGPQTEVDGDLAAYLEADHQLLKWIAFDESPEAVDRWAAWAGPGVQVHRTHPLLVEGTAPGVDKGMGVRRMLHHLGLAPERVLAIGDQFNDVPMFEVVGTSVAMGQAPQAVREAASWVAPSFAEDGVAAALAHFGLI